MSHLKQQLRTQLLAARSKSAAADADGPLYGHLKGVLARAGGPVAAYFPQPNEPNILPFISELDRVLIPRLFDASGERLPAGTWGWHRRGEPWERPRPAGPAQPGITAADLQVGTVLLPALAVDRSGTRLGRGGGWYDRALLALPGAPLRIAVVFPDEVLAAGALPREPHDLPVDGVVTAAGWEFFNR